MSKTQELNNRRALLQYAAVLGAGVTVGGLFRGNVSPSSVAGASSPVAADATATREAELAELSDLRTQVANPPVCTPPPTATPVPPTATATEVPIAQAGVQLAYLDIWTLTILGIAPTPGSDDLRPAGQFMRINFEVSHSTRSSKVLLFNDFVLVDGQGRFSRVDRETNRVFLGNSWEYGTEPGVTEPRAMIFDVAADAGDLFVLESDNDPTFRVALRIEERG